MGLFDIFSGDKGAGAARRGYAAVEESNQEARGEIDQGRKQAYGFLDQGIKPFEGLYNQGQQGIDLYGQLAGLGGADMQGTLENIPGYQFSRDQGLDALNRTANSRGMLQSGNQTQDILKFSQGLADQNYFNYLGALQPYFGLGSGAASGIQSGYTNKANTAQRSAEAKAGLYNNLGQAGYQQQADIYGAQSSANANLWNAILGLGGAAIGAI